MTRYTTRAAAEAAIAECRQRVTAIADDLNAEISRLAKAGELTPAALQELIAHAVARVDALAADLGPALDRAELATRNLQ